MTAEYEEDPVKWEKLTISPISPKTWKLSERAHYYWGPRNRWYCLGNRISWYSSWAKTWNGKTLDSDGKLQNHIRFKDKQEAINWTTQANFAEYGCTLFE